MQYSAMTDRSFSGADLLGDALLLSAASASSPLPDQPALALSALPATGFDAAYYLAHNPDVAAAGVDPYQHYLTYGWKEGRDPSAAFSVKQYLAINRDVAAAGIDPLQHYQTSGAAEGRLPRYDGGFDAKYYLAHNPDVAASGIDPLTHFLAFGRQEGRNPSAFFDAKFYLAHNPDVAAAGVDPYIHYETSGWKEGRDPSAAFSIQQYLLVNPSVAAAHTDPLQHFLGTGAAQGLLPRYDADFDRAFYLAHNPDVAAAGIDPFLHYLAFGAHEGRNPNAYFDTAYYLAHNPDVAAAGVNPLIHYEVSGESEGRAPSAAFDPVRYLAANPDVAASHVAPLQHYLTFGIQEGRATGLAPGRAPTADLGVVFRQGPAGSHATAAGTVELVGSADPGSTIRIAGLSQSAIADAQGQYRITGIPLALGHTALVLTATDTQGRIGATTFDVTRIADATGTVVTDWNQLLMDAVSAVGTDPQFSSRAMALEGIAVLDVVNAIQGKAGFLVSLLAPTGIPAAAAIAAAAHDMLVYLFPTRAPVFDAALARTLATIAPGAVTDQAVAFGKSIAAAVVAIRDPDGWNRIVIENGSASPGLWRPTAPDFGLAQDPQWGNVTPFTLVNDSEFRAPAPPAFGSPEYLAGLAQLQAIGAANSTTRTAEQTQITKFWADGAGTETPPGHWNLIAQQIVSALGLDSATQARVLAEVDVALADAGFAAWDTKFTYDTERPISVIRSGDAGTTADPTWSPLIKTPPHPSYVSGHSSFSAAAASVLDSIFGLAFGFTTTDPGLPGIVRTFTGFDAAAAEAAISRVYGGIHFTWDSTAGLVMGTQVGSTVVSAFENTADAGPRLILDRGAGSTSGPVTISGFALDDAAPLAAISARLDGGAAMAVTVDATGRFTLATDTTFGPIVAGAHSLLLTATDSAGHAATSTIAFTRGSGNLSLSLTAPSANTLLVAGAHLTGLATAGAAAITSIAYQFDGGTRTPILYGADGRFDVALDLSTLAIGTHSLTVTATDATGGISSVTETETIAARIPLTVTSITPANGATDIGVTQRPEIAFSRAVDMSTITANSFYVTDAAGRHLDATIIGRADGTGASLFLTNPLPGASTVTVHVVGSLIKGQGDGATLDATGAGTPGSTLATTLVTVNTAALPTTILTGIIADPGLDLQPNTADDVINGPNGARTYKNPLVHAKVYVLGQENQAVYTDDQGRFTLTGVPAGTVKVAIDGRTATNAPDGVFFPEMVMNTQVTAGITNTLPGGMGTPEEMAASKNLLGVYLPRIQNAVLTTVSATIPTTVTVPMSAGGLLSDDQRSKLSLTVQPGSIVDALGNPVANAQIGISPVPSDLVKDMLPAGLLQHSFDITIQVPGGAALTTPATLTMPNVFGLAPGEKTYFLSFDHTTGKLVIDGTATASADGLTITTDPGQGVTKPGWHGVTPPGSSSSGPSDTSSPTDDDPPAKPPACDFTKAFNDTGANLIKNLLDCLKEVPKTLKRVYDAGKNIADVADNLKQLVDTSNAMDDDLKAAKESGDYTTVYLDRAKQLNNSCATAAATINLLVNAAKVETAEVSSLLTCINAGLDYLNALCGNLAGANCITPAQSLYYCSILNAASTLTKALVNIQNVVEKKFEALAIAGICDQIASYVTTAGNYVSATSAQPAGFALESVPGETPASIASSSLAQLSAMVAGITASLTSFTTQIVDAGTSAESEAAQPLPDLAAVSTTIANIYRAAIGAPANVYYEIVIGTQVYRGITDGSGRLDFFFPAKTAFEIRYYDPRMDYYAVYQGVSAESGATTRLPNPLFLSIKDLPITGPGGLPDIIEEIVGGSLTRPDTLVPGVKDVVAVHQGVEATRSLVNSSGVIATAALDGIAKQVTIAGAYANQSGQYAYVAAGTGGLAILDIGNPLKPVLVSQTALPSDAQDVAVDAVLGVAAVADGTAGLLLLDITNPAASKVTSIIQTDARVVVAYEGIAYTTNDNALLAIDMATGAILQRISLGTTAQLGLARDGTTLWALDQSGILRSIGIGSGAMVLGGALPGINIVGTVHLYAAAGVLYVPTAAPAQSSAGYTTVDIHDPANPVILGSPTRNGSVSNSLALNGSGQGVAIGNTQTNAPKLDLIDTTNPAITGTVLTEYALPSTPWGVAIGGGVAYVADGASGLVVVNYKATDTSGTGPTITITKGPGGASPAATSISLPEGSKAGFEFTLSDPGQIRDVQLLVNGAVVLDDFSYPFELETVLPSMAANGAGPLSLSLRVVDTAGNAAVSAPVSISLTPDRTPPALLSLTLAPGSTHSTAFRSYAYLFSKPIADSSLTAATFTLAGPGGTVLAPTTIQTRADGRMIVVTYATLSSGDYLAGLNGPTLLDRAGNAYGATTTTAFTIRPGDFTTSWSDTTSGNWTNILAWEAGQPPTALDKVLLDPGAAVTITHATGNDTIAGLALRSGTFALTGGSIVDTGALAIGGGTLSLGATLSAITDLDLTGGTLLFNGGTLDLGGGHLKQSGGAIAATYASGTLANAIVDGPFHLDTGTIIGSGATRLTGSTIDLRGATGSASLILSADQALAAQTVTLGLADPTSGSGSNSFGTTGKLTVDAASAVLAQDGSGSTTLYANGGLVNAGLISIAGSATIYSTMLDNRGTITIGAPGLYNLNANLSSSLVNSGTITITASQGAVYLPTLVNTGRIQFNGGLSLTLGGTLSNTGTIDIGAGNVTLQGNADLPSLSLIRTTGTGVLDIRSTLDLTGTGFTSATLPNFRSINLRGGTLKGGTNVQGDYLTLYNGTLDGTTWSGGLSLAGSNTTGMTFRTSLSVTGGALDLRGGSFNALGVNFFQLPVLAGLSILMGSTGAAVSSTLNDSLSTSDKLTLAASTTITVANGWAYLGSGNTNQGVISVGAGARLQLASTFVNQGTISLATGSTLQLDTVQSLSTIATLSGLSGTGAKLSIQGTFDLAGSTLSATSNLPNFDSLELLNSSLKNGTLDAGAGAVTAKSTSLDSITLDGTLLVSNSLYLTTAFTSRNAAIRFDSAYYGSATMTIGQGIGSLDNIAITAGTGNSDSFSFNTQSANPQSAFTLGAAATLTLSSQSTSLSTATSLINAGTISISSSFGSIAGQAFSNQGRLTATAGKLTLSATSTTNSGTISVATGATLAIGFGTDFSNTGTLALASGATVQTGKATTLAALGTVTGGGVLDLAGGLDLGAGTLKIGTTEGFATLKQEYSQNIGNGTIAITTGLATFVVGTKLTNVALQGAAGALSNASLVSAGAATANADGSLSFGPNGDTVKIAGSGAVLADTGRAIAFLTGNHDTVVLGSTDDYYSKNSTDLYGFDTTKADILDVSTFLARLQWDGSTSTLSQFIAFSTVGNDTLVTNVNHGFGSGRMAVLHDVHLTQADLLNAGALKTA